MKNNLILLCAIWSHNLAIIMANRCFVTEAKELQRRLISFTHSNKYIKRPSCEKSFLSAGTILIDGVARFNYSLNNLSIPNVGNTH